MVSLCMNSTASAREYYNRFTRTLAAHDWHVAVFHWLCRGLPLKGLSQTDIRRSGTKMQCTMHVLCLGWGRLVCGSSKRLCLQDVLVFICVFCGRYLCVSTGSAWDTGPIYFTQFISAKGSQLLQVTSARYRKQAHSKPTKATPT